MYRILIFLETVNNAVWGLPMIFLLLGIHIYFSVKLRFVQRFTFKGIKLSFSSEDSTIRDDNSNKDNSYSQDNTTTQGKSSTQENFTTQDNFTTQRNSSTNNHSANRTSAFDVLSTTLAATLGTGNIIGISSAIVLGGPGAVFWCWITGILGMATSYAECYLSIKYREQKKDGTYSGGPMYVLEKGLNKRYLAIIFCLCTIMASFGVGCTTQSNAIYSAINTLRPVSATFTGISVAILCGLVIIGGVKKISSICKRLVPCMAVFYIIGCIIILFINREYLTESLSLIVVSAFTPQCVVAGITAGGLQKAARYGVSRGLFTNEAGLGSAPIAAAEAESHSIYEQSIISMTAAFWDTVVMCAITGIVVISTLLNPISKVYSSVSNQNNLVDYCFDLIPYVGNIFLSVSLILFAFATLVGWSFFGERAFSYLFGEKRINIYKIIYIVMIYLGTVISMNLVWEMCDFFNALMLIPNVITLILLRNQITVPKNI